MDKKQRNQENELQGNVFFGTNLQVSVLLFIKKTSY